MNRARTARLLALTAALTLLAGCAAPMTEGTVTGKEYDDPDTWITPGWMQTIPGRAGSCSGTVCTPGTPSRTIWHPPITHHDPECWRLLLADGDRTGSVCVHPDIYDATRVGTYHRQGDL